MNVKKNLIVVFLFNPIFKAIIQWSRKPCCWIGETPMHSSDIQMELSELPENISNVDPAEVELQS